VNVKSQSGIVFTNNQTKRFLRQTKRKGTFDPKRKQTEYKKHCKVGSERSWSAILLLVLSSNTIHGPGYAHKKPTSSEEENKQ